MAIVAIDMDDADLLIVRTRFQGVSYQFKVGDQGEIMVKTVPDENALKTKGNPHG